MLVDILAILINLITIAIIYLTLILGILITLLSSHWLLTWIGLEMNMLAIIPIIINKSNPQSTEAATQYFLTQASALIILLFSTILTIIYSGQRTIFYSQNQAISLILSLYLIIKLGLAAFHFWVPRSNSRNHTAIWTNFINMTKNRSTIHLLSIFLTH